MITVRLFHPKCAVACAILGFQKRLTALLAVDVTYFLPLKGEDAGDTLYLCLYGVYQIGDV